MKIYTKTGDKGQTSLFNGERRSKDDIRIEAYGSVDELNSFLGLLANKVNDIELKEVLIGIQKNLFDLGSMLANPTNTSKAVIKEADIEELENGIDNMNEFLPALKTFILPGGNESASLAHVCRTVCRRAERRTITLSLDHEIEPITIKYLNRLSDYFFVLSRKLIYDAGDTEIQWLP